MRTGHEDKRNGTPNHPRRVPKCAAYLYSIEPKSSPFYTQDNGHANFVMIMADPSCCMPRTALFRPLLLERQRTKGRPQKEACHRIFPTSNSKISLQALSILGVQSGKTLPKNVAPAPRVFREHTGVISVTNSSSISFFFLFKPRVTNRSLTLLYLSVFHLHFSLSLSHGSVPPTREPPEPLNLHTPVAQRRSLLLAVEIKRWPSGQHLGSNPVPPLAPISLP